MYQGHPKDHKKISYKLPLGGIATIIIIIIGFATMENPVYEYKESASEIHKSILLRDNTIAPEEAGNILSDNKKNFRFIDLRNPHEFLKGHIEGAINIPVSDLFSKEHTELLSDTSYKNILYSDTHVAACGPWMMLKQVGYSNNLILMGGYYYFNNNISGNSKPNSDEYLDEKAKYDYAEIVKKTSGNSVTESKPSPGITPPVKKKKKKSAEGGC